MRCIRRTGVARLRNSRVLDLASLRGQSPLSSTTGRLYSTKSPTARQLVASRVDLVLIPLVKPVQWLVKRLKPLWDRMSALQLIALRLKSLEQLD